MIKESHILDYIDRMPGLPTTVTKIVELANNLGSSPKDLIQTIKLDPVLTARMLRLINSAYFGLPQKITSTTRAVILLGINTLKNLALSTSVMSAISVKKNIPEFNIDTFWEHSLGCAVASKILAKKMRVDKNYYEEYFIAGLMHDIGKVLLIQYLPNDYAQVLKNSKKNNTPIIIEEQNLLGTTHAAIGALIGKKWELAENLIESIEEHHNPTFEGDSVKLKLAVHIADIFCNLKGFGLDMGGKYNFVSDNIWDIIEISQPECDEAFISLPEEIESARVFLQTSK